MEWRLINCVETYLPMEEAEYLRLVSQDPRYQESPKMILTTYDRGMEAGEVNGSRDALRKVIFRLATRQCGAPDENTRKTIDAIEDVARLENLVEVATTVSSWEQLLAVK